MNTLYIEKDIFYDGSQLKPLYAYTNHKVLEDSAIAFCGGCNVSFEKMVDVEDLIESSQITSDKMLHFIIEVFNPNLYSAVLMQRLFTTIVQKNLFSLGVKLERSGDDLYFEDKKLSISIASCSAVSSMIHFAVNITNDGTPVKTCSLQDFKIEPKLLAHKVMEDLAKEYKSIIFATKKVKPL